MKRYILSALVLVICLLPSVYGQMDGSKVGGNRNAFSMARIKWGGGESWFYNPSWAHDYPVAEHNLMTQVRKVTSISITEDVEIVELDDPALFNHPFAYMCEVQDCTLSEEEAKGMREYLLRGGFIMVDDSWSSYGLAHFAGELKKAFPDRSLERVTTDHPIFNAFYEIEHIPIIRGRRWGGTEPICYGLTDDSGRLMMLINWENDIGDGWEWAVQDRYTGLLAYKLGINYVLYAMSH